MENQHTANYSLRCKILRFLSVATFFLVSSAAWSQGSAQIFWNEVDGVGKRLQSFWDRELNESVNQLLRQQDRLRAIKLKQPQPSKIISERCEIIPKADVKTQSVRFNRRELLALSFTTSYLSLIHI